MLFLTENPFYFQALNKEGGYGEPRDMHGPIMSEPYYEPYVVRHPLDYGMTRAYSGGYIGPGASKVSTVSGFFFLNRLSFNSSAPSPFASSTDPSCLSSSPLQPPAPIATLSFPSSPLPASPPALSPLSALCPFLALTAPSPTLSSSSPLPYSPTQTSQVNQMRPGYKFHPRFGASFLQQSII